MSIPNKKCPKCGGAMLFYDGCLGYESIVCKRCGYDVNDDMKEVPCAKCGTPILPLGVTECEGCREQDSIRLHLESIADRQIKKSFLPEYRAKATVAEGLGIAIANLFEWDGLRIMETMFSALEDANFHTEAAIVAGWLEKYRAFFHRNDQPEASAR